MSGTQVMGLGPTLSSDQQLMLLVPSLWSICGTGVTSLLYLLALPLPLQTHDHYNV